MSNNPGPRITLRETLREPGNYSEFATSRRFRAGRMLTWQWLRFIPKGQPWFALWVHGKPALYMPLDRWSGLDRENLPGWLRGAVARALAERFADVD